MAKAGQVGENRLSFEGALPAGFQDLAVRELPRGGMLKWRLNRQEDA